MGETEIRRKWDLSFYKTVPKGVIRLYRSSREVFYILLEPVDFLSRAINSKTDLPPLWLRRYVGNLRNFESSSAEFIVYLKLMARLQPHESVLDIGCGCGMMALQLVDYLDSEGSYVGVDIHKPSIEWCRRNITSRNKKFQFEWIDVKNDLYRPRGASSAERFAFTFQDRSFDVMIAKSIFTHLRPLEVDNYLKEISRLLSDSGRCLATFFLLNDKQASLSREGSQKIDFRFGDETCRQETKGCLERAVAYSERYVSDLISKRNLAIEGIFYGSWSGRPDGLSLQDIILLRRKL